MIKVLKIKIITSGLLVLFLFSACHKATVNLQSMTPEEQLTYAKSMFLHIAIILFYLITQRL